MRASPSSARSLGVTGCPERASSTGWRPSTMSSTALSSTSGRTWPRTWATSASAGHDVERGQRARGGQQVGRARRDAAADLVEQLVLEPAPPLVGAEHLGLVLLELGRDVALGAGQRLAPHVLGGHPRRLRVRHLDAVAEHAIEAHAQARQPGPRALALLEPGDPAARLARRR